MEPAASRRPWTLYVLECEGGRLYAGIAVDVEARFAAHCARKGAAFTRMHRPLRIVAARRLADRAEATRAEIALKRLSRPAKLEWVRANPWPPSTLDPA